MKRTEIMSKTMKYLETGRDLKDKMSALDLGLNIFSSDHRSITDFKQKVEELEREWKEYDSTFKKGGRSILLDLFLTMGGLYFMTLSIVFSIQLIAHDILQVGSLIPFVNTIFYSMDTYVTGGFPIISVPIYYSFALYLMICTIYGFMKVSRRVPFFSISPLTKRDSSLSSILIHFDILLIVSFAVNQYLLSTLSGYFAGTQLGVFFNVFVCNIRYTSVIFTNNIQLYLFAVSTLVMGIVGLGFEITCNYINKSKK
jgi:hypothetical protein